MPEPDEVAELRALQARAYGRDAALTDAEAARLRELESARFARPVEAAAGSGPAPATSPPADHSAATGFSQTVDSSRAAESARPAIEGEPAADGDSRASDTAAARVGRLRPGGKLIVAAAALVVVGIGVGWVLFGRGALPPAVPASQHEALALLEDSTYDPGSVRFMGEQHEVGIWRATREDGDVECVVLTHGDVERSGCQPTDPDPDSSQMNVGLSASIEIEDGGDSAMVWAAIMTDISGREAIIVQHQLMTVDWRQGLSPAEIEAAEALENDGFEPTSLYVVGYDVDLPVWQGTRDGVICLAALIDDVAHRSCADTNMLDDDLELRVGDTVYALRQTPEHGSMFSITRYVAEDVEEAAP